MKFTAYQIAGILDGEIVENADVEVFKLAKIEEGKEDALRAKSLFQQRTPQL